MCACLPLSHSRHVTFGFVGRPVLSAFRLENSVCVGVMAHCMYLCVCRSSDSDMNGNTCSRGPANTTVEANSNANNLSMASHSPPEAQNHSQVSIVQYTEREKARDQLKLRGHDAVNTLKYSCYYT